MARTQRQERAPGRRFHSIIDSLRTARPHLRDISPEMIEEPFLRRAVQKNKPAIPSLLDLSLAGFERDPLGRHADSRLDTIAELASGLEMKDAATMRGVIQRVMAVPERIGNHDSRNSAMEKVAVFAVGLNNMLDEAMKQEALAAMRSSATGIEIERWQKHINKKFYDAWYINDVQGMEYFLGKGADVNTADGDGKTPLIWSSLWGKAKEVRFLLGKKANVDARDKEKKTPLICAAGNGHVEVMKLLLDAKAAIEAKDKDGTNSLMWASLSGRVEAVEFLLEKKVKVNDENEDGDTALIFAARGGYLEVVKALIKAGANPNHKNKRGQSALESATTYRYAEIAEFLKRHGAVE